MSAPTISFAAALQTSLADASPTEVLAPALHWVEGALSGSLATGIAIIAVASIGFGMLSGRISVRRGGTILLGCFILFGASSLARGIRAFLGEQAATISPPRQPNAPIFQRSDAPSKQANESPYDPYAGAAVQR
jgi:type IV secretory pathway VirB2 component (pilin)